MEKFYDFSKLNKYDELLKIDQEIKRYQKMIENFQDKIQELKSNQILNNKNNSLEIERLEKNIGGIKDKIKILEEKRRLINEDLKKI